MGRPPTRRSERLWDFHDRTARAEREIANCWRVPNSTTRRADATALSAAAIPPQEVVPAAWISRNDRQDITGETDRRPRFVAYALIAASAARGLPSFAPAIFFTRERGV